MSQTYRSILLTGAGGFVGGRLMAAVAAEFPLANRVALSRRPVRIADPAWRHELVELVDRAAVDAIVQAVRPDLVLHLAAHSSVSASTALSAETWMANSIGSLFLAEAIAAHAPSATVFFTSSGEIYGRSFMSGPATETTPAWPESSYSGSKIAAEKIFDAVLKRGRLITARPFNHTGPGQDQRFVLPSFAAQIAKIEAKISDPEMLVGNLEAARDFLDVEDVVRAYLLLLKADLPPRTFVNVSSGRAHRIGDLFEILKTLSSARFVTKVDPTRLRPSDIPYAVGDCSLLMNLTGWRPLISIETTLSNLLGFWRLQVTAARR